MWVTLLVKNLKQEEIIGEFFKTGRNMRFVKLNFKNFVKNTQLLGMGADLFGSFAEATCGKKTKT